MPSHPQISSNQPLHSDTRVLAMTAGAKRVTVYAKSTVVAATPVRPGRSYPLSALDHTMGRHTVHLVFYFRPSPSISRDSLKESLSEVLSNYPAVTGRLSRSADDGGWVVKCNDAGVRVMDARAAVTLEEWLESADDEEEMELVFWEAMGADPTFWSPFYVQITEFEDTGFAVGLTCPHMHSDPVSTILLVRAWSDAHRRACLTYPPFFHPPAFLPRPTPNPSAPLLAHKSTTSLTTTIAKTSLSSAVFSFSAAAITTLVDFIPDATPFSALTALFWSRITALSGRPLGPNATITISLDFRKRMHAPLPHGFYGNAFHFTSVTADLSAGFTAIATELARQVGEVKEDEFWDAVDWVHEWRKMSLPPFLMYGPELTCMAMDHVLGYGSTFEKDGSSGRPTHLSLHIGGVEGEGLIIVMPTTEEGGRVVAVNLPEEVAVKVCRDDGILKYGPTVMFAPKSGRVVKN